MRLLRILLWLLGLLAVAVPLAAWLVPPRLDLDRYRADIASAAAERFGRRVVIGGRITLRLLPEPILTAQDIAIGTGETIGITAAELRLQLALGALMEGRIDARELTLRGADMRLPWPLDPSQLMVRTPYWLSALSATIEDGRLSIGGLSFTGVEATLTTSGFGGSYAAAGTAQFSGQPWQFTARLTQPGGDGSAGLDVTLDGRGPVQGMGVALTGQIAGDGTLLGRISGRGPDLSHLLPAPPVSFQAEGRISIAGGLAAADDLAMQIAGSPARGALALRVSPEPRLDLALTASRLDLDAWLPVLTRHGKLVLPVGIDLSAEAATLAGGTLRGLRAAVDLTADGADLREARAVLPGDAPLRLSGRVTTEPGSPPHPRFEGDGTLTAPAFRTTLGWLAQSGFLPLAVLPPGVLRDIDLTGHVVAEPGQIAVGNLQGRIDASRVGGSLTLRAAPRAGLGAGLSVDRLDLDAWFPAGLPGLTALPARLGPADLDLRVDARAARLTGLELGPLSFDAAWEANRLVIRKADAMLPGAHASASGTIAEGGRVSEGRLDVQADTLTALAPVLPDRWRVWMDRPGQPWRGPVTVQVLASGPPERLGLHASAELGDLRIETQPILDLGKGAWTATAQIHHPGTPRLAEALGVPWVGAWLGDGSLSVVAQLSGAGNKVAADTLEVSAGGLHATGGLLLDHLDARPQVLGHLAADTLPITLPDPHAAEPWPLWLLSGWDGSLKLSAAHVTLGQAALLQHVTAGLTLSQDVLKLDDAVGSLARGAVSASIEVDGAAKPPAMRMAISLSDAAIAGPLTDAPVDVVSGIVQAGAKLTASGNAPATLLATLGGEAEATLRGGAVRGLDLSALAAALDEPSARAALTGGESAFDTLHATAHIADGIARLTGASLTAPAGTMHWTGLLDLPGSGIGLHADIQAGGPDRPLFGLRLDGSLDAPTVTPELAGLARWRIGHPPAAAAAPD